MDRFFFDQNVNQYYQWLVKEHCTMVQNEWDRIRVGWAAWPDDHHPFDRIEQEFNRLSSWEL